MIPYPQYSPLLNRRYDLGFVDCFSLVRDFHLQQYEILLPNYARPSGYAENGLFEQILSSEEFIKKPAARENIKEGSVLAFRVASDRVNHLGIYVGNNLFIHHLHGGLSREDNLDQKWFRRLVYVVRHQDAPLPLQTKTVSDFLSPYFKQGI